MNVEEGQQATFQCRHSTANTIGWSVNNVTTLNELSIQNIHVSDLVVFPDGSVQNELTFDALSQRNGSVIKCVALFIGDMPPESSPEVVLFVQGVFTVLISMKSTCEQYCMHNVIITIYYWES